VARRLGCGTVIAAEVSVEEDSMFTCTRIPSPWEAVRGRALFRPPLAFPSLIEVVMRASMLHSVYREKTALLDADLRLSPPIDRFGLMEFDALDDIVKVGYEYAREAVAAWAGRAELVNGRGQGTGDRGQPAASAVAAAETVAETVAAPLSA
jgi:predicted acylesterase/phospholipase RssA